MSAFEPRGLLFVNDSVLVSDIAEGHGWLISATADDFGLPDCDGDGVLDECEIAAGSLDCNSNGVPDECEVDCNVNGVPDQCDLINGTANDCNGNFIPDSCEPTDCNGNGQPDDCDIASGFSSDVNGNFVPDECDTGSCCDSDGACTVTIEAECLVGAWMLDGICEPNPCPQPGTCCANDGSCAITLEADCIDGAWTAGQTCDPNFCPQPGACCRADTSCSFILEATCVDGAWTEGEECTLANCPSADCNQNGIRDDQDIAGDTSDDCNGNGVPDECDIAGAGTTTVFAEGMNVPEDIVASQGDYPPGFFVPDFRDEFIYHVSPLGGTVIEFAEAQSFPIGAVFAPDEFGGGGTRLFATISAMPPGGPSVHFVRPDGTVEPFAALGGSVDIAPSGIAYIPSGVGGVAGGRLFAASQRSALGEGGGSIHTIDADGAVTTLISSLGNGIFTPAHAPADFGQFGSHVFFGASIGPQLYAFNLSTNELTIFATVPLPTADQPGLRQIVFSPVGWGAPFDPALANEPVLLVSVASGASRPRSETGFVSVWDQRGRMLAALTTGPDELAFEPRGMLFVKNDLLVSDITDGHGWLIRATIDDFGLPDCDGDGILGPR